MGNSKSKMVSPDDLSLLRRIAFSIPEFCFRNNISRPTYHRLRDEGRGPVEMRLGLNIIRITADAEREWQQRMQKPQHDVELKAVERAVKAATLQSRAPSMSARSGWRVATSEPAPCPPSSPPTDCSNSPP